MYALMSLCGILAAGFWIYSGAKKEGYDETAVLIFLLAAAGGALLGGHLLYALVHFPLIAGMVRNGAGLAELFRRGIFGGAVYYGGLLGGLAAGLLYARLSFGPFPFRRSPGSGSLSDIITPAIPLFHVFGRIGCFFAGCCFGVESGAGFVFTRSLISGANGVRRFPVQLLEAVFNLSLFFLLCRMRPGGGKPQDIRPPGGGKLDGKLLFLYLLLYPAGRFLLEGIRGDTQRGIWGFFSTSQWISIALIIFSLFKLLRPGGGAGKKKKTAGA